MSGKWKIVWLCSLFLLIAGNLHADELFSAKLGYQLLAPEGSIAGSLEGNAQEFDVEDDLNLDDSEDLTGEIALQWGNSRLSLNYLPISFSGTGTLTVSGTFGGEDYTAGETVSSDLDIDLYDISYTYYLLNFDDLPTRFQLGLELAVKVADIDVTLKNLSEDFVESESVIAPIPTIGARTRIALADFLAIVGRIGYLEFDDNHFLDAEAQLEYSPVPNIGIYAGTRIFDLKVDEDDVYVETQFSGPFGGLLVRF